MRSRLHVFVSAGVWLLVILLLVSGLSAQQGAGNMTGKVSDPSQGVLQGARIELQPGGHSTQSDANGEFSIKDLSAGRYTVTVSHEGFRTLYDGRNRHGEFLSPCGCDFAGRHT
jgi:uncharacterized protein (DUF2141 family)